tara:strand:+ start:223 stop:630 length:408 start_codon:yes stop_codon:yes gene_type:complete
MSFLTNDSGSNNIYFNLPALMSDGRANTFQDPACELNNSLKKSAGINNNYDYRQYLIKNGTDMIKRNFNDSAKYSHITYRNNNNVFNKYLYKSSRDRSKPYGYESSDLKEMYLSRRELQSKLVGPIVNQQDLLRN